jgi:homoserine O-acetyltransferase
VIFRFFVARFFLLLLLLPVVAQAAPYSAPKHGDFLIHDFRFASGEALSQLKLHYFTLGEPQRDASGAVTNAVLLLHGTTGTGANFLVEGLAGELFGKDQPLDAARYYIIVPDNVGAGESSKPSDGLRSKFPRYVYADMVALQHRLVSEGLGIKHLRLILGTSMGGMHAWVWATTYPDLMDAVLPLVCLPVQVSGRNRMERRLIMDTIRADPEWKGGDYVKPPASLATAMKIALISATSARHLYAEAPTVESADRYLEERVQQRMQTTDANDFLYAWEASRDYDPGPSLERIKAAITAVNFADDERNPPELGILEREIRRVPRGRAVTVPTSARTRGHVSFYDATLWKEYLVELLARSAR